MFSKVRTLTLFIGIITATVSIPTHIASAEIRARTCGFYGGTPNWGYYGVHICVKVEHLPGGVRALIAFDCDGLLFNPTRVSDASCNYEVRNLVLYQLTYPRQILGYGHVTGKGYYQFATPWFKCNENSASIYSGWFETANVRFSNGQLMSIPNFSTPDITVTCA